MCNYLIAQFFVEFFLKKQKSQFVLALLFSLSAVDLLV